MVEEISYNELKKLWGYTNGRGVRFHLTFGVIEEWKQGGNFKHMKEELLNIPNVKFSCTEDNDGCWYTFFTHSPKMSTRILTLKKAMMNGERPRIKDVSNILVTFPGSGVCGTPKMCAWF